MERRGGGASVNERGARPRRGGILAGRYAGILLAGFLARACRLEAGVAAAWKAALRVRKMRDEMAPFPSCHDMRSVTFADEGMLPPGISKTK